MQTDDERSKSAGRIAPLEEKNRALEEQIALLRSTLNSTADGILVADPDGVVLYCNDNYLKMLRLDRSGVDGRLHAEVIKSVSEQFEDPIGFLERVEAIYDSPDESSFDVMKTADGRIYERFSKVQYVNGRLV